MEPRTAYIKVSIHRDCVLIGTLYRGGSVFGLIMTVIVTVMHLYVFWRLGSVPLIKKHVPKKILIATGVLFWFSFYVGRTYGHGGTGPFAATYELLGMNWMAVLFIVTVSVLSIDIVTGFGLILRRSAPVLRSAALVAGVIAAVFAIVQGMRAPVVESYDVHIPGLPEEANGMVIVAMSDLHLGSLIGRQWMEARVLQVRDQKPDLVVLLGDIVEGHGQSEDELISALSHLSAPLGVWAVPGNHESYGHIDRFITLMEESGVYVLRDTFAEIIPGLILAGVDDMRGRGGPDRRDDPTFALLAERSSETTILLSHRPWGADSAAENGVDLMLSGHTHGGQIWPFGHLVKREYPLLAGEYHVGALTVLVCRGTGTWGPRMRLWRAGEIMRVTLHRE
jgi:uncharacterized protein